MQETLYTIVILVCPCDEVFTIKPLMRSQKNLVRKQSIENGEHYTAKDGYLSAGIARQTRNDKVGNNNICHQNSTFVFQSFEKYNGPENM